MRSIPANTLIPPKAPSLPVGPVEYDQRYTDQLNNVLRIYFNELDNIVGLLAGTGTGGGKYLRFPYGAFESTVTQTVTANTETVMTLNQTDYANDVSLGTTAAPSTSKITVANSGIYNLQWSGQFQNTDTQLHDVSVWVKVNGSNLAGSTGLVSIPNSHGGVSGHTIVSWNYFLQLAANAYVELWWSSTSAQVSLEAYAAGTSPTRPTTASLIATLSFVSALPA
jgi:hypothetical protein